MMHIFDYAIFLKLLIICEKVVHWIL